MARMVRNIIQVLHIIIIYHKIWYGSMVAFLYTEGIQLTAAHSGGRCSDLTQEEVQHLWRYNLYSQRSILTSLVLVHAGYLFCN